MNRYKIIYQKKYTDRCISKTMQHEIIIDSELDIEDRNNLIELGNAKLQNEFQDFIQNTAGLNPQGWTEPIVQEIHVVK